MTAVWIVIIIVGFIAMVVAPFVEDCINITNSGTISFVSGIVIFITGAICYFAVPITGYMDTIENGQLFEEFLQFADGL